MTTEVSEHAPTATVWDLQAAMVRMPQAEVETDHYFADGMYCRVVKHAKDVLIVGKVHRREHLFIVASGSVAIIQDGAERRIYHAPTILVSQPGTKRAALALEDSVVVTVHRTDTTNLDEIESELTEPDATALFDARNQPKSLEYKT